MSSKMNSVALHKMKKILGKLSSKTGKGTELISLYIPPKKALHDVVMIRQYLDNVQIVNYLNVTERLHYSVYWNMEGPY